MKKKRYTGTVKNRIRNCEGPLEKNCKTCDDFDVCIEHYSNFYSRIPHFIADHYISKMSASAFKIFVYLNRKVNFQRSHNHYGRWWCTYKKIEKATGVKASNMNKYIKELKDLKLIKHVYFNRRSSSGRYSTHHEITVNWYKILDELRTLKKWKEKKR